MLYLFPGVASAFLPDRSGMDIPRHGAPLLSCKLAVCWDFPVQSSSVFLSLACLWVWAVHFQTRSHQTQRSPGYSSGLKSCSDRGVVGLMVGVQVVVRHTHVCMEGRGQDYGFLKTCTLLQLLLFSHHVLPYKWRQARLPIICHNAAVLL